MDFYLADTRKKLEDLCLADYWNIAKGITDPGVDWIKQSAYYG